MKKVINAKQRKASESAAPKGRFFIAIPIFLSWDKPKKIIRFFVLMMKRRTNWRYGWLRKFDSQKSREVPMVLVVSLKQTKNTTAISDGIDGNPGARKKAASIMVFVIFISNAKKTSDPKTIIINTSCVHKYILHLSSFFLWKYGWGFNLRFLG